MFWKKKSEAYNLLKSKLSNYFYVLHGHSEGGSKEFLPTKSDLDKLSKEELTKFKEKEIHEEIKLYSELRTEMSPAVRSQLSSEEISLLENSWEDRKQRVTYLNEFLEAIEAGGLKEKTSEEKASDENEDLISLINKKDGTCLLNHIILLVIDKLLKKYYRNMKLIMMKLSKNKKFMILKILNMIRLLKKFEQKFIIILKIYLKKINVV